MDVLALGVAGEQLLGVPPCDLAARPESLACLQDVLGQLMHIAPAGVGRTGEGCAWLEVVVSSCYSADAAAAVARTEAMMHRSLMSEEAVRGGGNSSMEDEIQSSGETQAAHSMGAAFGDPGSCIYLLHDTCLSL